MNDLEPQFSDIYRAYCEWAGKPISHSRFRRQNLTPAGFAALDVLCYQSNDEDCLPPEREFTFLASMGLSLQETCGSMGRVELVWRQKGRRSWEEIQALAESLASIAVLPEYAPVSFAPGAIVHNIKLPLFDGMESLVFTDWGVHSPEYLPGLKPPVQLLSIKALFDQEARVFQRIGPKEGCRRFLTQGVDWDDPARSCVDLENAEAEKNPF